MCLFIAFIYGRHSIKKLKKKRILISLIIFPVMFLTFSIKKQIHSLFLIRCFPPSIPALKKKTVIFLFFLILSFFISLLFSNFFFFKFQTLFLFPSQFIIIKSFSLQNRRYIFWQANQHQTIALTIFHNWFPTWRLHKNPT